MKIYRNKKLLIILFLLLTFISCNVFQNNEKKYKEIGDYATIDFPRIIYFNHDNSDLSLYSNPKNILNVQLDSIYKDSLEKSIIQFWIVSSLFEVILHENRKLKLTLTSISNKLGDSI